MLTVNTHAWLSDTHSWEKRNGEGRLGPVLLSMENQGSGPCQGHETPCKHSWAGVLSRGNRCGTDVGTGCSSPRATLAPLAGVTEHEEHRPWSSQKTNGTFPKGLGRRSSEVWDVREQQDTAKH